MNRSRTLVLGPICIAVLLVPAMARSSEAPDTARAARVLESLVASERAFSATSVERGMKDAFIENLADDGVVFAPGPVNGRERWASRPAPRSMLVWAPRYAEAAAAGDLGVSLGPWELHPPEGVEAPVLHGHFITVWKREGEDPWRAAVDLGVVHPQGTATVEAPGFEAGPLHLLSPTGEESGAGFVVGGAVVGRRLGLGVGVGFGDFVGRRDRAFRSHAHARHEMMSEERRYAFTMRGKGAADALHEVAADRVWVFREGTQPARGRVEAEDAMAGQPTRVEWLPSGNGVSASLDLGFSYGLARRWAKAGARPDTSAYLHVWRREPGGPWQLLVDVENPFPKP